MSENLKSHVLVVDDCEPLRYLKAHYLVEAGFHVSQAGTAKASLQSIETERPDLVLLDVNLPDMHGSEVCREVKNRWAIPVVFTSSVDIPVELHGMADGCVVSLDELDLLAAVRAVLHQGAYPKRQPNGSPAERSTGFACAERSSPLEISAQARAFESGLLSAVLDASGAFTVVLNRNQEIVFGNRAALRLAGFASLPVALGLQLCEAFHCIHATQSPDFCQTGGGAETASGKCHIVGSLGGEEAACDLMVTASPVKGPEGLVVCTLTDFTPEKQRRAIERQFFHDILNIAGGVNGCAAILKDELKGDPNAELAGLMDQCAAELLSEIRGQQQLLGAEVGQLAVRRAWLRTLELVQTAAAEYRNRADSKGRTILVDPLSADLRMETDPAILSRVLGNMLKNALEATQPGGTVTIGCAASQGGIEFCVHDLGVIPQGNQTQVFQRSFSSKGSGRAVRNYSMKLMTERYLGGTIRFESSPLQGTRFIAHYPMASPIDAS